MSKPTAPLSGATDSTRVPRRRLRGHIIAFSGTLPLVAITLFENTGRPVPDVIGFIALLLMSMLFAFGTALTAKDKCLSPLLGFALGLLVPLGTLIVVLLPDGSRFLR